ncbi:hypothetical protein [Streptomyces sp. NPDC058739]|uniref:hypothetical protein n=1 Tax=Streptomyces sp. NPDC058739 TaxID=3346618 RepID=UPI003679A967
MAERVRTDAVESMQQLAAVWRTMMFDLVRVTTAQDKAARLAVDLITRDENVRWLFPPDVDTTEVNALAAVPAESMTIPDAEREALRRRDVAENV